MVQVDFMGASLVIGSMDNDVVEFEVEQMEGWEDIDVKLVCKVWSNLVKVRGRLKDRDWVFLLVSSTRFLSLFPC